jgi:hypothetical protein
MGKNSMVVVVIKFHTVNGGRFAPVACIQFLQDIVDVVFDGATLNDQVFSYALIAVALPNQT